MLYKCCTCVVQVFYKCCASVVQVFYKCCTCVCTSDVQVLYKCCTSVVQVLYMCFVSVVQVLYKCCTQYMCCTIVVHTVLYMCFASVVQALPKCSTRRGVQVLSKNICDLLIFKIALKDFLIEIDTALNSNCRNCNTSAREMCLNYLLGKCSVQVLWCLASVV